MSNCPSDNANSSDILNSTLSGDDIPKRYRVLNLDELQVAARDDKTMLLQFSCNGGSIRVKHLSMPH